MITNSKYLFPIGFQWKKYFSCLPSRLRNGRWTWLKYVYRVRTEDCNGNSFYTYIDAQEYLLLLLQGKVYSDGVFTYEYHRNEWRPRFL